MVIVFVLDNHFLKLFINVVFTVIFYRYYVLLVDIFQINLFTVFVARHVEN